MLELLAKQHDDWIRIAYNMTEDMDEAQDLVQEMYLVVIEGKRSVKDITYKDQINRYFVWKLLRSLFVDEYRRRNSKKSIKTCEIIMDKDDKALEDYNIEKDSSFEYIVSRINEAERTWHPYKRQIFDLYFMKGVSGNKIAKEGLVPTSEVYAYINEIKREFREELGEDVTDYFNEDYDKI